MYRAYLAVLLLQLVGLREEGCPSSALSGTWQLPFRLGPDKEGRRGREIGRKERREDEEKFASWIGQ